MLLPHLRKLYPKVEQPAGEERLINASAEEMLEQHLRTELFDAIHEKDPAKFKSALEAVILNCFEEATEDGDE